MTESAQRAAFAVAFAAVAALGFLSSVQAGLTVDDTAEGAIAHQAYVAAAGVLMGDGSALAALEQSPDRYYGVGFHALSWPLRAALAPLLERAQGLPHEAALLAAGHVAGFALFLFGAFCFHRLLALAGVAGAFAHLATLCFVANPYVLGHAAVNVKDAPFMVAWLLCTWRMLALAADVAGGTCGPRLRDFLWLGLATAWLLSIRISGVLIAFQYVIAFVATAALAPERMRERARAIRAGLAMLVTTAAAGTWLSYPVFWLAPQDFLGAMRFMARHPWHGCTLTWGECLPAQALPWSYIPAWLAAKLSVVVIAGFALALTQGRRPAPKAERIATLTVTLAPLLLTAVLIATGAHLYNEVRQVLFLVPLVHLAAFSALAHHARITAPVMVVALGIALADNVLMRPYSYAWFNEAARFANVDQNFETDYWLTSGRELVADVDATSAPCIVARNPLQLAPYLDASFTCLEYARNLAAGPQRPFLLAFIPHLDEQAYGITPGCRTIRSVTRRLLFAPPMTLAQLQLCS